ncbi:MAG: hypothetical protein CUN49_13325 [Candidatus Thermofonsia Clade 1 bacterium]|jgi:hypothetical protein|uniref:STAS/SEC14 domain-containing protein n=1 Tax=Candidatus Thermofonsia Clade 1 bacterium TaxID=2364210 RepID=A0A2M8PBG0_9CHLR|nr:MAG: hypothetical protein CUN49_13325 [Candidatus Thermofonsia Clade 1 bacterium]
MPVTLELIENGRVLSVTFIDPWAMSDVLSLFPELERIYNAAERPIHALIDARQSKLPSSGALRARESPAFKHPMSGHMAVVGAASVVRAVAETVFRLARFQRVTFFDTYEEGLAFLRTLLAQEAEASADSQATMNS